MGSLTVLDGGLFTSIQDSGREGYRKFGVPVSGVMDEEAYKFANELVANDEGTPVLECTLKGGKYRFDSEAVIAITGALMNPRITGREVEMNTAIQIEEGNVLELSFAKKGCRTYVAIKGGWNIEKVMGSYSTYTQGNFGGLEGRTLKKGDVIHWKNEKSIFKSLSISKDLIPYYSSKITVEFVLGLEWNWLEEKEQIKFLETSFKVSSKSNRMGIRLETDEPISVINTDMRSSGVIPGIIQLPPSGNPIILMKDGQTVGGYPRIGKVKDSHLNRVAQLPPNGIIRLKKSEGF